MKWTRMMELLEAYEDLLEKKGITREQIQQKLKLEHNCSDDEFKYLLTEVYR